MLEGEDVGRAGQRVAVGIVVAVVMLAQGSSLLAATTSRVFVTSTRHTGDLQSAGFGLPGCGGGACAHGLAGGDAICSQRAGDAGLGGTWVAWLSTSAVAAEKRLAAGSGPFVLAASGVRLVALDQGALLNTAALGLRSAISEDEYGNPVARGVWTGTNADGSSAASCLDWTTSGRRWGMAGDSAETGTGWTSHGTAVCNVPLHLYCFETAPPRYTQKLWIDLI